MSVLRVTPYTNPTMCSSWKDKARVGPTGCSTLSTPLITVCFSCSLSRRFHRGRE